MEPWQAVNNYIKNSHSDLHVLISLIIDYLAVDFVGLTMLALFLI